MKQIPLTQGKFALVDDEDYEYLSQWNWYFDNGYAVRSKHFKKPNGKWSCQRIRMHRVIMNAPENTQIDHINLNKSDNRRENLRFCDTRQNQCNRRAQKNNTSGFKGVSFHIQRQRYCANITHNKKHIHVGIFDCPIEAAKAYNEAAIKYHGEFAKLNQIPV